MGRMIFAQDNRVEVAYGLYGPASGRDHRGIDIDTLGDGTIHSTVDGRVKYARCVARGAHGWGSTWEWGNFVWVVAADGSDHIFAHCRDGSLRVAEGQRVCAGQPLGLMGKTGNAAGDRQAEHVHYEVRRGGRAVDPTPWCGIPNRVGTTMNPRAGEKEEDEAMYVRLYGIHSAYESRDAAAKALETLAGGAKDPKEYLLARLGHAGYTDGKTRLLCCRMKRQARDRAEYTRVRAAMAAEARENEVLV